jgi:hypothetical protein
MNPPAPPQLEFAFTVRLVLNRPIFLRPTLQGATRAAVYVTEGDFAGPAIRGRVIPMSGADWALMRPDGVIDFDARYMLEADDGTPIYIQNRGFRWGTEAAMAALRERQEVADNAYYMRTSPRFEVPEGPHDWLAKHVFVGRGEKTPEGNKIHYFKVS